MSIRDNRPNRKVTLSKREVVIRRVFKAFVRRGIYSQDEYHKFCIWSKGKTESELYRELENKTQEI